MRTPTATTSSTSTSSDARSRWTLPIAAGAGFLGGLDTTAVNLALPDLQRDLDAGLSDVQWIVNAFALLSATLLVVAGNLSDRYGARGVFLTGLLGFAAASAVCGLAWSSLALVLARALQGGTAAVLIAGGLAVLARAYPPAERGRALGIYSSVAALSFVVGPLLGGVLTDALGWRAVFLVNVPVALLIAAATATLPVESVETAPHVPASGRRASISRGWRRWSSASPVSSTACCGPTSWAGPTYGSCS